MKKPWLELCLLLAMSGTAQAAVTVTGGWFRALPAALPAGGYFTAHNGGTKALAITGAQSPACSSLMLHHSSDMGGMSSMAMVDSVPVPAGGAVSFAPDGYHLMCMDAKLKPGTQVPVTLNFSDGSKVTASFAVKNAMGK